MSRLTFTKEQKQEALRRYVIEAIHERDKPSVIGEAYAPEFESHKFQTHWIDSLTKALQQTDALDVLAEMIGAERE